MVNRLTKLILSAGFIILISLMHASVPEIFIVLSLGLLLIPPVLAFVSVLLEGAPIIKKELRNLLTSGKVFFVISVSRESITLEPQFE